MNKTWKIHKYVLCGLIFLLVANWWELSYAQDSPITNGLSWLCSNQNPDGSWGNTPLSITTPFHSTSVVVNTFHYLAATGTIYTKAIEWIGTTNVVNTDYLARKVEVLAKDGKDVSDLVNLLLSYQQEDGGWGLHRIEGGTVTIHRSEVLRTTLALYALQSINSSDTNKINSAINFIINNQNPDGGWRFTQESESSIYLTGLVMPVLYSYRTQYYVTSTLEKAINWLISQQNPDGSFGNNMWETALAYSALMQAGSGKWEVGRSVACLNYILVNQQPNGSWEDDPFTTALCLRALKDSAPDLAIRWQDINFEPSVPVEGEPVTIKATVWNYGGTPANDVEVVIGERLSVIGKIGVGGSATVSVTETFTAGTHKIVVTADPADKVKERDETNNTASRNLTWATLPDLTASISFEPAIPQNGDVVSIKVIVYNLGESAARDVVVELYDGNPAENGYGLGTSTCALLPGGAQAELTLDYGPLPTGNYHIYVLIDPLNTIVESNEANNIIQRTLTVGVPAVGPSPPTGLVAIPGNTIIDLLWNSNPEVDVIGYNLYRDGVKVNIELIKVTTYRDTDLVNGVSYTYTVTAVDRDGLESNFSSTVTAIPLKNYLNPPIITAPTISGIPIKVNTPLITVSGTSEIDSEVEVFVNGISAGTTSTTNGLFTKDGVNLVESENIIMAIATRGSLVSKPSLSITVILDLTPPSAPQGLEAMSGDKTVFLRWQANSEPDFAGSNLYRDGVKVNTVLITLTFYQDTGLINGKEYTYVLRAVDDVGNESLPSEEVKVIPNVPKYVEASIPPVANGYPNTPAIGDIDGDGHPEIVFGNRAGYLCVFRKYADNRVENVWSKYMGGIVFAPTIGDLNNDGHPEIIFYNSNGYLYVLNHRGEELWKINTGIRPYGNQPWSSYNPSIGDINHDDILDIAVPVPDYLFVLDGKDGRILWTRYAPTPYNSYGEQVSILDLDDDGTNEILYGTFGGILYLLDSDGGLIWSKPGGANFAIADLDLDGQPEVITIRTDYGLTVYGKDGSFKWEKKHSRVVCSGGIVADLDLDGKPEIVFGGNRYPGYSDGERIMALRGDGTLFWETKLPGMMSEWDDPDLSACDLNGDEIPEIVVVTDDYAIIILEGRTGQMLVNTKIWIDENESSPAIADVDNDGHMEIIVPGGSSYPYLYIFGDDAKWGESRHTWNQMSYYVTNIRRSLATTNDYTPWKSYNTWRTQLPYPDFAITSSDINFSNQNPTVGEKVTITAKIYNIGRVKGFNVEVSFYDGEPLSGGNLIATQTIPILQNGTFTILKTNLIASPPGSHSIYVVIDQDNKIDEKEETNNQAQNFIYVHVFGPPSNPDLTLTQDDIEFSPVSPTEGQLVDIIAAIHNQGNREAKNVMTEIWQGKPGEGGSKKLEIRSIEEIQVQGSQKVKISWNTLGNLGRNYIYVVVDPENMIDELNELNNISHKAIDVSLPDKPDLSIDSLSFSNPTPTEGDEVVITAVVHNYGKEVSGVKVRFSDMGEVVVSSIPLGGTKAVSVIWNTLGKTGEHEITAIVDSDNQIDELDETNNSITRVIFINSSQFSLTIKTNKVDYTAFEDMIISLEAVNLGNTDKDITCEVEIGDLEGNLVSKIGRVQFQMVKPEEKGTWSGIWNTGKTVAGNYQVKAVLSEAGIPRATSRVGFVILPVLEIESSVATDKISYSANSDVTIVSKVKSLSPNFIFPDLTCNIQIATEHLPITDYQLPITNLLPNSLWQGKSYWNTCTNPPGTYSVTQTVYYESKQVSQATASFHILSSLESGTGITGQIGAEPKVVEGPEPFTLNYSLTNTGNIDLGNLTVRNFIVDPDTEIVVRDFTAIINLPLGTSYSNSLVVETAGLGVKAYLIVLQAEREGKTIPVASSYVQVIDIIPPVTTISIGIPNYQNTIISRVTPFILISTDNFSGVAYSEYNVDNQGWSRATIFTLVGYEDGTHTIGYRSVDKAGNVEGTKSITVILDATAPKVDLTSPSKENIGVCQIFQGTITILGIIEDIHLEDYQISYAQGTNSFAWIELTKGTTSTIEFKWDTSKLTQDSYYTLKVTAEDKVTNLTEYQVIIFIGKPTLLGTITYEKGKFHPSYVALDEEGYIYVTNHSSTGEILKFDAKGKLIEIIGQGEELNHPEGITIDSQDNIYVADTNNDRVVKFDKEGRLIMEITQGLNKPVGIAIGTEGNIYATDCNHNRIVRFSQTGDFLMEIGAKFLNKPEGISLDLEGNIYVADSNNDRVVKFDKGGNLRMQIGQLGKGNGEFNKPEGIVVNGQGYIYVADRNNNRIEKFDKMGSFMIQWNGLNKPAGIACDSSGNIYVVDRNNQQVKVFGLPK